eukprot:scaffold21200_cov89-Skeletonema_dohrnii-CCMP3373.AAC.2
MEHAMLCFDVDVNSANLDLVLASKFNKCRQRGAFVSQHKQATPKLSQKARPPPKPTHLHLDCVFLSGTSVSESQRLHLTGLSWPGICRHTLYIRHGVPVHDRPLKDLPLSKYAHSPDNLTT